MQEAIIVILFASAIGYLGRKFYLDFTSKNACPKGCGACEISKEAVQ